VPCPSFLFVHQFYQTPAVASVWVDALVGDRTQDGSLNAAGVSRNSEVTGD
jgi:hypothetical protein